MPVVANAIRLLGAALGAMLCVSLAVSAIRSRRWRLLIAACAAGLWFGCGVMAQVTRAVTDEQSAAAAALDWAALAGVMVAPAAMLNLVLFWAGLGSRAGLAAYLVVPILALLPDWRWAVAATWLGGTSAAALLAGLRAIGPEERRFWRCFSVSIAIPALTIAAGLRSAPLVWASLAPLGCIFFFIYRHHIFGLEVGRRFVFTIGLGAVSAVYLLAVRLVARSLEHRFDALGSAIELTLTLAAAILWLPFYGWMTRVISRRGDVLADFGRRGIEQAVGYLDLGQRIQFLAEGVARTFDAKRVVIATAGEPAVAGVFPAGEAAPALPDAMPESLQHVRRGSDPLIRRFLAENGFHYFVPLRYEESGSGAMLIDCSPRTSLDDQEPVAADMARQISHSIEACRLVDQKIGLERELHTQEQFAALGNVAASIAHEVKNPLSSIRALAQLMAEDRDTREKFGQDLGYIVSETDRLTSSVRQLLTFARPSGEVKGAVEVSPLLEAMARTLDREHAAAGIRVAARIEPGLNLTRADGHSVQQIALNLMRNSVQASSSGDVVQLDARADGSSIVIRVTDKGPGIPGPLREKIFQPYFTTKQKGTGLGLAIVRKNVRDLGGVLDVESPVEQGRGTRMTVRLPVR